MSPSVLPTARDRDDRLRMAMAAAGIGIGIADLQGQWLEADAGLERMLGYDAVDLAGRPVATFFDPDDKGLPDDFPAGLVDRGEPAIDARMRCLHRDGTAIWTHAIVHVVRNEQCAPNYLLVQLRDITAERAGDIERQESERRRADAVDAAQRQLQLFADAVAHDLRAPLRSIESFSGLLATRAEERLDNTDRDYLGRIRAAARRMSGLLAQLSELSAATRAELKPGEVDLGLLAEWVGAELQEADPERRAEIVVQPGLVCWGDERLLKQLLVQLMGNAWKFSRSRDSTHLEIGGGHQGGILQISVRDEGIGFDTRYAHKMFEPFQRLHGNDQGAGHGLGLTIAQRIAERHGGRISADSRPEGGATFIVELPAAKMGEDASHA